MNGEAMHLLLDCCGVIIKVSILLCFTRVLYHFSGTAMEYNTRGGNHIFNQDVDPLLDIPENTKSCWCQYGL